MEWMRELATMNEKEKERVLINIINAAAGCTVRGAAPSVILIAFRCLILCFFFANASWKKQTYINNEGFMSACSRSLSLSFFPPTSFSRPSNKSHSLQPKQSFNPITMSSSPTIARNVIALLALALVLLYTTTLVSAFPHHSHKAHPTTTTLATPTPSPAQGQCNTGAMHCCNSVQDSKSDEVSGLFGILGLSTEGLTGSVGIDCSPLSVLGFGGGNWYVVYLSLSLSLSSSSAEYALIFILFFAATRRPCAAQEINTVRLSPSLFVINPS